jgi:hypothetical protein
MNGDSLFRWFSVFKKPPESRNWIGSLNVGIVSIRYVLKPAEAVNHAFAP